MNKKSRTANRTANIKASMEVVVAIGIVIGIVAGLVTIGTAIIKTTRSLRSKPQPAPAFPLRIKSRGVIQVSFRVDFEALNDSEKQLTVIGGVAQFSDGENEVVAHVRAMELPGGLLKLSPNGGFGKFRVVTEDLRLSGRKGRQPELKELKLDVPQLGGDVRFTAVADSNWPAVVT